MEQEAVITFDNLRQSAAVVGENAVVPVTAKTKPFVSANAHGVLRAVKDHNEVAALGSAAAKRVLALISSKD